MGKLDTTMVSRPEGADLAWDAVDWRRAEDHVRRLRRRIFTVSRAGDLKTVRSLQKLTAPVPANALVSVRRVTEVNAGRRTAGVDGRVVLAGWGKADMAAWLQRGSAAWRPLPVRRVFTEPVSPGRDERVFGLSRSGPLGGQSKIIPRGGLRGSSGPATSFEGYRLLTVHRIHSAGQCRRPRARSQ